MSEELHDRIARAVCRFHRDEQGQEPGSIEVHILDNLVVVRCHDVFTSNERGIAIDEDGRKLIQSARRDQRSQTRRAIEAEISRLVGRPVPRSFYDIDTRNGEQVEVYVLA